MFYICKKCNEKRMKYKYFSKENLLRFGERKRIYHCDECQSRYTLKYKTCYVLTFGPYNKYSVVISLLVLLIGFILVYCDIFVVGGKIGDSFCCRIMWLNLCVWIINETETVLKWVFLERVDKPEKQHDVSNA